MTTSYPDYKSAFRAMILEIFHRITPGFNAASISPLRKVATLTTEGIGWQDAIDRAYAMTNDFGGRWYINHFDEIVPEPGEHRGTTEGDIILIVGMQAFQVGPGTDWAGHTIETVRTMVVPG